MAKNDDTPIEAGDVLHALQLLSRLPVPLDAEPRGAAAAWAYPLAGLIIGAVGAATGLLAHWMGLPAPLSALVSLATLIVITGALHEDGLADTADGFWGGWDKTRRLEIMKDSRIGAFGVIALFLGLSARWGALWMLYTASPTTAAAAVLVAATGSRAMMSAVMSELPNARDDGLSARVGDVGRRTAGIAIAIAAFIGFVFAGWGGLAGLIWAGLLVWGLAAIARQKIGGRTGDTLGATQQLAEIAILFSLVA